MEMMLTCLLGSSKPSLNAGTERMSDKFSLPINGAELVLQLKRIQPLLEIISVSKGRGVKCGTAVPQGCKHFSGEPWK